MSAEDVARGILAPLEKKLAASVALYECALVDVRVLRSRAEKAEAERDALHAEWAEAEDVHAEKHEAERDQLAAAEAGLLASERAGTGLRAALAECAEAYPWTHAQSVAEKACARLGIPYGSDEAAAERAALAAPSEGVPVGVDPLVPPKGFAADGDPPYGDDSGPEGVSDDDCPECYGRLRAALKLLAAAAQPGESGSVHTYACGHVIAFPVDYQHCPVCAVQRGEET